MLPPNNQPLRFLISFSPADRDLKDQLVCHLKVLVRFAGIELWTADRVRAGENWRQEVDAALDRADVALLLMSADFLASDFLQDVEVPKLFRRREQGGLKVIPIILRACAWKSTPFGELEVLPTNKNPITSWTNRDEAWADVVHGVSAIMKVIYLGIAKSRDHYECSNCYHLNVVGGSCSRFLAPIVQHGGARQRRNPQG